MKHLLVAFIIVLPIHYASSDPDPESQSATADHAKNRVAVETYTPPKGLKMRPPRYPRRAISGGMEGYAILNLMVAPDGSPYEVTVSESSNRIFERAAIRAVEASEFAPAVMGDKAIDAGMVYKLTFELTGGISARKKFTARYRALLESILADDRPRAEDDVAVLKGLDITNNSEHALLHLGLYQFYLKWGDDTQRLKALNGVTSQLDSKFLNPSVLHSSLLAKFALQTRLKDFGGALQTYELIGEQNMDATVVDKLATTVASIRDLKADDRAYAVEGEIPIHYSWFFRLFKKRFQLTDVVGEIAEIKLRCERDFVSFRFDPDLEYSVSEAAGECGLELLGNPNTTFKLVQR